MTRFEIQDIASQNQDGVTFRALDKSTDQIVSLRRFFPFGQDEEGGEGLDPQEGKAYSSACQKLSRVHHPALRKTIFGDTDPVDGMPFLVTEWIEGESLADVLGNNTMEPRMIIDLVRQALDVCVTLSNTLENEAVWIDTKLESIIVSNPTENPSFSFRICPFKWLGTQSHEKNLTGIVTLVESLMGWKSKLVSDQAGLGLGGWLKLLRQNPQMGLQDALLSLPDPTTQLTAEPIVDVSNRTIPQPYILPSANQSVFTKKSISIMALSACLTGALIFFFYQQGTKTADVAATIPMDENSIVEHPPKAPEILPKTETTAAVTGTTIPEKTETTLQKTETTLQKTETTPKKTETILPKQKLWSPAEISTAAWYDASTASIKDGTVSIANAGTNGGAISGPASIATKGIGNLQAVQFNGTNQYLTGDCTNTGTTLTVFFVGKSLNTNQAPFAGIMSIWENSQMYDWNNASSAVLFSQNDTLVNSIYTHRVNSLSSSTGTLTTGFLATTVFNGSTHTLYLNGTPSAAIVSTDSFNANKVILGARWQKGAIAPPFWNGNFGETIICNTDLSTPDRQKIEGYLAHKWDLAGELPANHPYKLSSPDSSSSKPETLVNLPKKETKTQELKTAPPKIRMWSPDDISITAWYDAADTSTLTATSDAVSQWRDKSGNGLHLDQVTAANQPATGALINGRNALNFTGDAMTTASNPFGATINNAFVIAVHKVDSLQNGILFSLTGSDVHANRWSGHVPWSDGSIYFDCGGALAPNRIGTPYGVSVGNVVLASFYTSTENNLQQIYKNGSLLVGDSSGHAVSTAGNISVGGLGPVYQDTTIGEFIIINGTVDDATRQKIEGYLAHKWSLVEKLPADHPYKLSAPIPSILTSGDTETIKTLKVGDPVVLQGIVRAVKLSSTGKSIYLSFSDPDVETDIRVVIHGNEYDGKAFTEEEFANLIGKNLVFSGTVYTESFHDRPPFVKITEKKQIKLAKEDAASKKASITHTINPTTSNPASADTKVTTEVQSVIYTPDDLSLIEKLPVKTPVKLRGTLTGVKNNKSKSAFVFQFSEPYKKDQLRGIAYKKNFKDSVDLKSFDQFIGKEILLDGVIFNDGKQNPFLIEIFNLNQISIVPK
ncbi:MAG: hypothetical protein V4727_10550 [Verrucomicrobiota bacterium]